MKTKQQIIDETVAAYPTIHERAAVDTFNEKGCYYLHESGKMCAFGRCEAKPELTDNGRYSTQNQRDRIGNLAESIESRFGYSNSEINHNSVLKDEYKGHSLGFWADIQQFHDSRWHWNEAGNQLSQKGIDYISQLRKKYPN